GEVHVRAGVAVRDREDVEPVDLRPARGESRPGHDDPAAHGVGIEDVQHAVTVPSRHGCRAVHPFWTVPPASATLYRLPRTPPPWRLPGAAHTLLTNTRRYPWLPTATSAARDRPSDTPSRTRTAAPSVAGTRTSSAFGPRWATRAGPRSVSTSAPRASRPARSPADQLTSHKANRRPLRA